MQIVVPGSKEERIQIEQIRLLLGNLGSSAIPGILVALVMVYSLYNKSNLVALLVWCALVIVSKLFDVFDARRILASSILPGDVPSLIRRLVTLHAIDGAVWGSLAWITLGTASPSGSVLVLAVLSGIVGNSMSLLSPVLPAFFAFCVLELGMIATKVWQFHEVAFNALGIAAVLYVCTLLVQARNSARASRQAIELRFENVDLVQRLRLESEKSQQAMHKAEQANIAKSRFLAAASHDLRQPIHAQGLFLEVLARTELAPAQRQLIASIRSASDASADMLHTLLDYSRIEAGVVEPQLHPFKLQSLMNKIENELAPQADAKSIVYRSRETDVVVMSDPALVELILRNLVSNAIRYTVNGGVLIGCRRRGGNVWLEVWDTGIGIAPSQQTEVFREFHQLGNPERDRQKGLGLGLAIVQGLAAVLGHELSLLSVPHRGSVFRLVMPTAVQPFSPEAPQSVPADKHPALPEAHILIIDDDQIVRAGMVQLLSDWGYHCMAADSIEEALWLTRSRRPDIIISDYRLREQRTGTEAIQAIRAECGMDLPALLITGDTAPARLREARASGLPLLHKPVSPSQLQSWLASVPSVAVNDPEPPDDQPATFSTPV
ncbi:hybrid sensor histidine kinase/response regulator [Herbaspirillum sp. RV1423]|uniref:ATP-binding response regulator n=1 Tax=Herbaspirillum sp. RV1423 TaxID=1443993 RepID=UPI0004B08984|nr:hybrid sensor histidine kinase/response regulator [Herbaspirillum sp. RV1423]